MNRSLHRNLGITVLVFYLLLIRAAFATDAADAPEQEQDEVWVDVRSAREFRQGHVEAAINIPHGDIGHKISAAVPDTFIIVHIYDGDSGTFAGLALEMLMEIAYQQVINEGGYEEILAKSTRTQKP